MFSLCLETSYWTLNQALGLFALLRHLKSIPTYLKILHICMAECILMSLKIPAFCSPSEGLKFYFIHCNTEGNHIPYNTTHNPRELQGNNYTKKFSAKFGSLYFIAGPRWAVALLWGDGFFPQKRNYIYYNTTHNPRELQINKHTNKFSRIKFV